MANESTIAPYPTLAARVSPEQMNRFLTLLAHVRKRDPHLDKADLLRMLLGFDLLTEIAEEERDYLSGKIDQLPAMKEVGMFQEVRGLKLPAPMLKEKRRRSQ